MDYSANIQEWDDPRKYDTQADKVITHLRQYRRSVLSLALSKYEYQRQLMAAIIQLKLSGQWGYPSCTPCRDLGNGSSSRTGRELRGDDSSEGGFDEDSTSLQSQTALGGSLHAKAGLG